MDWLVHLEERVRSIRVRERQPMKKIIHPTVDTEPATNSSAKIIKVLTIWECFQTAWNEMRCLELLNVEADPATEEADINAACTKIFATSLVSTS
jgi:hypothetical protein